MRTKVLLTVLLLASLVPTTSAQDPTNEFFAIQLEASATSFFLETGDSVVVDLVATDMSRDSTEVVAASNHRVRFRATPLTDNVVGWSAPHPPGIRYMVGGDVWQNQFRVSVDYRVQTMHLKVNLSVEMETPAGLKTDHVILDFFTFGPDTFNAQGGIPLSIEPDEITETYVRITNSAVVERAFDITVVENPCGMRTAVSQGNVVPARQTVDVPISFIAPSDRLYYFTQDCSLSITVTPSDNPVQKRSVFLAVQVTGGYFDPSWLITAVLVAAVTAAIFLLLARRKARIEEEILGKPQKPWTIPVEMVYLDYLKERDPQAHYVVRHYLMEEEYSSAMAWYREYKKATRGSRAKERLVVNQEHKYARFRKKWKKRIAKPQKKVDSCAAGLQKKLDRRGKKGLRKDRRKWKKLTKKMKAAHEKKQERATKKWEKKAKRAQKKKQPVPEKPVLATPDYPPEPSKDKVELAKHPWNAKVEKARRKAVKKQGNLEVKFEKEDAKVLRKVRKRVHKIARKLDDPDFAAEHPILAKDAKSS